MDNATSCKIMIVGADTDFSYLMQRYVRQSGCQMLVVPLSADILTLVCQKRPEVVILEADAPEAVGWEIVRRLKADDTTREIPVVVCSWSDEQEQSLTEDAADYLRKPVLYDDFLRVLGEIGVRNSD